MKSNAENGTIISMRGLCDSISSRVFGPAKTVGLIRWEIRMDLYIFVKLMAVKMVGTNSQVLILAIPWSRNIPMTSIKRNGRDGELIKVKRHRQHNMEPQNLIASSSKMPVMRLPEPKFIFFMVMILCSPYCKNDGM